MINRKVCLLFLAVFFVLTIFKKLLKWEIFIEAWYTQEETDDDYDRMKLYDVLGVDKNASSDDIKKSYRKLSKKISP